MAGQNHRGDPSALALVVALGLCVLALVSSVGEIVGQGVRKAGTISDTRGRQVRAAVLPVPAWVEESRASAARGEMVVPGSQMPVDFTPLHSPGTNGPFHGTNTVVVWPPEVPTGWNYYLTLMVSTDLVHWVESGLACTQPSSVATVSNTITATGRARFYRLRATAWVPPPQAK